MSQLEAVIKEHIAAQGPLSVAHYMQLALQHPEYGYYVQGDPLGRDGDFITAPEISQLFGEMMGVWLASLWKQHNRPDPFVLLELGPGRGTLMEDILRATKKVEGFHDAMQIFLLESNVTFQEIQKEKLKGHELHHISSLAELPPQPVFVVANEFFDAMPVHQYKMTPRGWREIMVGLAEDTLSYVQSEQPALFISPGCSPFFELSPQSIGFMHGIAAHISEYKGAALIIDYGYAHPPGYLSLRAIKGHEYVDPLVSPGLVDLSIDVDFGALGKAAAQEGLVVSQVIGQGDFLKNMGIRIRADKLRQSASTQQEEELNDALWRLLDPSQMGMNFKVMGMNGLNDMNMPGFL